MRTVFCSRLKREAEGFDHPPFPGRVGEELFQKISKQAWEEWKEMQTKIINEYRLDLGEAEHRRTLMQQMRNFLGLDEGETLHVGTPTK